MGDKQYRPRQDAVKMFIPLYGFIVFIRMANSVAKLAKNHGITYKLEPNTLFWLLVLAGLISVFMPPFLYPLTVSIATLPWLILHYQMNSLRLAYRTEWRQPENRYTWSQLSVFIFGVPLMGLVIYGSMGDFKYFASNKLTAGQSISGQPSIYQLQIPDSGWRMVPTGTLYKDTNLELVNKPMNEWLIVRVQPNQQQTLDGIIDIRQQIVAADWKQFKIDEKRTLDSGATLTPISIAHYSVEAGIMRAKKSLFVATVVTPEHVVEVIGQGSINTESTVQELVKSFRLTAM